MYRLNVWIGVLVCGMGFWGLGGCSSGTSDQATWRRQADPSQSTYKPTPTPPHEVGERLVGPTVYTVDARSHDIWMYFDFSRGAVVAVQNPKTDDWDLAFQRHVIRTNGGETNPAGQTALATLEGGDFATLTQVPDDVLFIRDKRSPKRPVPYNPAIQKWYDYSYLANVLVPKPAIYLVRTQDGKYAKMRLLSYYCEGGVSGCMTFEYVYQGDGSPDLDASARQVSQRLKKH